MNNINREYLCLAASYLQQFIEETKNEEPQIKELQTFLAYEGFLACDKTTEIMISVVNKALNKLTDIYKSNEITVNIMSFVLANCSMLMENNYFKGSKSMKMKRLYLHITQDVEANAKTKKEVFDAYRCIDKLGVHNKQKRKQL